MKFINHFNYPLLSFPPSYVFQDKNLIFVKTTMKIRLEGFNLNFKPGYTKEQETCQLCNTERTPFILSHLALFSALLDLPFFLLLKLKNMLI